jgi:tetratricopeptide (TPR) repeat protein
MRGGQQVAPFACPPLTFSSVLRILSLLSLLALPFAAEAQFLDVGGPVSESDVLYMSNQPRLALDILETYLATDSMDYAALWRAARAAVVIGIDEEGARKQNGWLDPAMGWAERAVALNPAEIDGHYWHGVAAGRRAMNAAPKYAAKLAAVVYNDAHTILAVDSLHGGAHNMLGKLNYEIMTVSRFQRLIARTFLGNPALDDTSWENAEYHLALAALSWPDDILFHFDLAQLYKRRGREEEAVFEYRIVLSLQPVHPTDFTLQEQARTQLDEWDVPFEPGNNTGSGARP